MPARLLPGWEKIGNHSVAFHVGVDVSSKRLDPYFPDTGESKQIANDEQAIAKLCESLKGKSQYMVVMEASGGYEALLSSKLGAAGVAYSVLNAKRVHDFAKSMGKDAKTDNIDARVISDFASVYRPIASEAQSKEARKHAALVTRRTQLVDLIT